MSSCTRGMLLARPTMPRPKRLMLGSSGQATVEAAIMIPIVFLLLLLLAQPAILLYNQIVMENAAAEGCRLLSTRTEFGAYSGDKYVGYVKRRLAAVPPLDIFHASASGAEWQIELIGDESSDMVSVRITNRLRPLPIIGWGAALLGLTDSSGYIVQTVEVSMPTQPNWAFKDGGDPSTWPTQWED